MTAKREKFARLLFEGKSQRQAYLAAFPASRKWKTATVDNNAYVLAKDDEILARLNELRAKAEEKAVWNRDCAANDLVWLKEQAKKQIRAYEEVTSSCASAILGAVKELNALYGVSAEAADSEVLKNAKELLGGIESAID